MERKMKGAMKVLSHMVADGVIRKHVIGGAVGACPKDRAGVLFF
jgi:hypothetical protein